MTLFEIIMCILVFVLIICLVNIGATINDNAKESISVVNAQLGNIDVSALEIRDALNNLVVEDDTEWLEDIPARDARDVNDVEK